MTPAERPPVPIRPFSESLPMVLLRAREAAMRRFRPMLASHDLTEQQWRVLRALAAEQPADASRIAEHTFLLPPSLTRILAHLEARGLIQRAADEDDRRRTSISLADRGWELVATVAPRSELIYSEIENAFGRTRLRRLLAELEELGAVIPQLVGDGDGDVDERAANGASDDRGTGA